MTILPAAGYPPVTGACDLTCAPPQSRFTSPVPMSSGQPWKLLSFFTLSQSGFRAKCHN